MKKLAKLAALLAAGALVFGFAACSGDDDNDPPKNPEVTATATLTGSAGMLKIGEAKDVKATLTVDGDTFIDGDIKSSIELTAGTGVTATVTDAEKSADKKSAELTISVTAAAGAQDGTITAKIKADALTDTSEPVTAAGSIAYQIDDGKPYAELELDDDAVELDPEAEEPKEINATVTVGNTEFTEDARRLPVGGEILEEYFKLSASDEKVTVSKAKVVAWGEDGKSVKISFTATAAEGAQDGTITAEIYKDTLKDVSETLNVAGSIAYTVKSATQTDPNPSEGDDPNVFVLEEASATINLGKTNIGTIADKANDGGKAYISVTTNDWGSSNTIGEFEDTFYNLSGNSRSLTITVKNVAGFTVYVKNSTAGRTFTVKVGSTVYTVNHPASVGGSDIVPFTFNTGTKEKVDIVLGGGSGSVYPGYIVLSNTAATIGVKSVEIKGKMETVALAESSITVTAEAWNDNYTAASVTWDSSDKAVATVDGGVISLIAVGKTIITATAGDQSDSFELEVVDGPIAVQSVTVSPTSADVKVGRTKQLTATITPESADNKNVTWESSDDSVASVDGTGLVTGKSTGTATITVRTEDGNKTAECTVTVSEVEYVKAGTYGFATGDNGKGDGIDYANIFGTSGFGPLVEKSANGFTVTCKVDNSAGLNLKTPVDTEGKLEFALNTTLQLSFTDTASKGVIISTEDGYIGSQGTTTSELLTAPTNLTLGPGTYTVVGATSSSAKIAKFIFTDSQ